jgi:hypothetical protein
MRGTGPGELRIKICCLNSIATHIQDDYETHSVSSGIRRISLMRNGYKIAAE